MSTQPDPVEFKKSGARMLLPNKSNLLSRRLAVLAAHRKRTSGWWSAEVKKLIEPAGVLERRASLNLKIGFGVGLASGLILAFYLSAF